jgi:F-type H+-transporting ATPase subunit b
MIGKYSSKNLRTKILFITGILLLCSFVLFASPENESTGPGEKGEHESHFNWTGFLGQVLNSTLLFGGLIFLLRKPILKYLDDRSKSVKIDIEEREENLKKTAKILEEIRNRLDRIEEEVEEMKNSARKSGEEEKQKIQALGRQEAERVVRLNEEEINQRIESAVRKLKEKVADLTIEQFKKEVKTELDDRLHEKIIEKNIEVIGELIERK